jgi:hypothetical protein
MRMSVVGPPAAMAPCGAVEFEQVTRARASGVGPVTLTAESSASSSISSFTESSADLLRTTRGNASCAAVNASSTRSWRARRCERSWLTIAVSSDFDRFANVPWLSTTRWRRPGRQ